MAREIRISVVKKGPNIRTCPGINPEDLGLDNPDCFGPWQFLITDALEVIKIPNGDGKNGSDHSVFALILPHHNYLPESHERVYYLVSLDCNNPITTFLGLDSKVGGQYLGLIGGSLRELGDDRRFFLGFNIAGYNGNLGQLTNEDCRRFHQYKPRRQLAQSVPLLHAQSIKTLKKHLASLPKIGEDGQDEKDFLEIFSQRLAKEMGLENLPDDELRKFLALSVIDRPAIERWRGIFAIENLKDQYVTEQGIVEKVHWRVGDEFGLPQGLEFVFKADQSKAGLGKLLENCGLQVWGILRGVEEIISDNIGLENSDFALPGYNFSLVFHQEEKETGETSLSLIFCPSDSIRAGLMEKYGIIVHRPSRGDT